jgi:hypothetical protein
MPFEHTLKEAKLVESGDILKHAADIDKEHPQFEGKHVLTLHDPDGDAVRNFVVGPFKTAVDVAAWIKDKGVPQGAWSATVLNSPTDDEGEALQWGTVRRKKRNPLSDPRANNDTVKAMLLAALMGKHPDDLLPKEES